MALSQDLINQFVKLTNNEEKPKEVTVKGTYKMINNEEFVQIDGSDIWTPVTSTVEAEDGERVTVMIKDHTATITGNISSPSARTKSVQNLKDEVDEHGNTIKQLDNSIQQQGNSIIQMDNNIKQVENTILQHDNTINQQGNRIQQINNTIVEQGNTITSMNNTVTQQGNQITEINNTVESQGNTISQHDNTIKQHDNLIDQQGNTIKEYGNDIELFDSQIKVLNSAFIIENGVLKGLSEIIVNELETDTLNAKYANIDFTNINYAAVKKIFTESGIIKDLIVSEGKITGELVGVTIKGDLIEGNTVKADKLVVKGEDGLYYKLNVDSLGETKASSDIKYQNGLDGSVIIAKSIVAEKVAVDDLVAFGATIGGFNISKDAIYSGAKSTVTNTTRGLYLDKNGQIAIGDSNNFIKYFLDTATNTYKLEISAGAITTHCYSKTETDNKINDKVDNLQIGGRNLVLNTSRVITPSGDNDHQYAYDNYRLSIPLEENQEYIVSADVEVLEGDVIQVSVRLFNDTTNINCGGTNFTIIDGRIEGVIKPNSNYAIATKVLFYAGVAGSTAGNKVKFSNVKMEKGNKATDWTPAPEDVNTSISNAQTSADNAQTKADNAQTNIDNLSIGGRNLLLNSSLTENADKWNGPLTDFVELDGKKCAHIKQTSLNTSKHLHQSVLGILEPDTTYTMSGWVRTENITKGTTNFNLMFYHDGYYNDDGVSTWYGYGSKAFPINTGVGEWHYLVWTFKTDTVKLNASTTSKVLIFTRDFTGDVYFYNIKLEKGNKATDWTPAPEDVDESIDDAQITADSAQTTANSNQTAIQTVQSTIQQLSNMISHLITDENGGSLMTQTPDGWTFNMSTINSNLQAIQDAVANMDTDHSETYDALEKLTNLVNDVANKTAYITMSTDENGDPCIELGKSDNLFKVRITNTAIDFLEGSTKIAYVNNNTFYTEKLIVKNELQIGEGPGFVWRTRANGNMGLVYISE